MSNIYIQEPPALGKVLLKTTVGDIDIELWTKETPKACRNFIQLCMEGYYNGTIFHRLVPDFIVQGGDPIGNGTGGESIYGKTFKDEFHSRLRFNRRGLVAMANAGKDDNGSQFFFTLNATPELQNKHTIFGKVSGETVYNMLKLADGETDHEDRPLYPHKITGCEILLNPFEDIVPRVTPKAKSLKDDEKRQKKKNKAAVKNFGLLSFGEEAEEDEDQSVEFRGKPKSTHDLLNDPKLAKQTAAELGIADQDEEELAPQKSESDKRAETEAAVSSIKAKLTGKKASDDPKKLEGENDTDSSEEEYYLGKDKAEERKKKAEEIRSLIKQFKKDLKKDAASKSSDKAHPSESDSGSDVKKGNELFDRYILEQQKYKKLKESVPKKGASRKQVKRKPWVKNLYENRGYPDNYTDEKFLQEMKKNLHVQKVTLTQSIFGSIRVTQRLCFCILFAVTFVYMYNGWIKTENVIVFSSLLNLSGYCLYLYLLRCSGYSVTLREVNTEYNSFVDDSKTVVMYLVFGYILSPILHTLTDTVSTDTIFAMTVLMMIIHLIFFDYGISAAIVSNSLSVNAAIFASICLASRLSTPFNAFILLTVSVSIFVLSQPLFKLMLGTKLSFFLCGATVLFTVFSLSTLSFSISFFFVVVVFFVNVYFPALFVRWQIYKDNIYGPWDEAVVRDSDYIDYVDS